MKTTSIKINAAGEHSRSFKIHKRNFFSDLIAFDEQNHFYASNHLQKRKCKQAMRYKDREEKRQT